jgi:hypothetical protein
MTIHLTQKILILFAFSPIGFSGDSHATWASLEFQPEFTATASNIGYGFWSHDIGGHIWGSRDDECTVRWVQQGVFSPILRLHSSNSRWQSKEPWCYRTESELIMRDFMQLRHKLVPYIYSATLLDLPLIQPLYWEFPLQDSAYKFPNQYYFGPSLVVSPVVHPRDKRTNLAKTRVWVPPRRHLDILTGSVYDGDQEIDMYRPLQQMPILAAEGAIIPLDRELVLANGCPNPSAFEVLVVVGHDGHFDILENSRDDGELQSTVENQRSIPIKYEQATGRLTVASSGKEWTFRFLSTRTEDSKIEVSVDGIISAEANCEVEFTSYKYVPCTVVQVPATSNLESLITIELGPDPQLAILDYSETLSDLLLDFQIAPTIKDDVWGIIESDRPTTVKIARLLSLELDARLLGPLTELLLSDSRE